MNQMVYPLMFKKGKIGNVTLKNRIVMPPMGTDYSSFTGEATEESIKYYEARAKGGCGLIITEITRIDDVTGVGAPGQLSATSTKYTRKLVQLVDAVHKYDTKIFMQLHHPGREVSSRLLDGVQPVAPSPIACGVIGEVPRELTTAECEDLVKKFIIGANVAKIAGFDGVELHGAHGYLINQFLSPYTNHRNDKYGGDFERRLTFITEIIKGIQATCGPQFPISVRISADEFVEGGLKIEDTIQIAKRLESLGIVALDVSAGTYESGYAVIEPHFLPEGWKRHLATAIKKEVNIPVIATNNIKHPQTAEKLLEEGVSDFVGVARGQLADPEWGNKAFKQHENMIRKCIGCLYCFKTINEGKPVECTVNPIVGREWMYSDDTLKKTGNGEKVAVIGAGPGGMQAAYILAKRGYDVTIYEKSDALGGTMRLAEKPTAKELIGEFIDTQVAEIESVGVHVKLNTEATVALLKGVGYNKVVLASGGYPIIPNIDGIHSSHVHTAESILDGSVNLKNKRIVVIGGGVTGLETAEVLGKENEVSVIEMQGSVGTALYPSVRMMLLRNLAADNIEIQTNKLLSSIAEDRVIVRDMKSNSESEIICDDIILALGVRTNDDFVEQFQKNFDQVMVVGDAHKPGQISDALREANDKAYIF